jgi:tetratricopeptide (TPR) repeat protein
MHLFVVRALLVALFVVAAAVPRAIAQTDPQAQGSHKHYEHSPEADQPGPGGQIAPRLQNLGSHTFPVSTKNRDAQLFVNQGLNLAFAFNHAEARRAFREAARLDPTLAIAYWGQALVLGPNINAMMESSEEPAAYELVQKALSLKDTASPREVALIEALAERYSGKAEDRRANDEAYATAMRAVQRRFPGDDDVTMLYVESMMDLRPWGYWQRDGRPHEGTLEIVSLTEDVMKRSPKHPGALHMYIHLMEAYHPERAVTAADTLLNLMPAAGHMVHMPSHIYQRVGRYEDAVRSNEMAILADEDYITQCRAQGLYPMGYYPHNIHFRWFAATADGQGAKAIESAKKVASKIDDKALKEVPITAGFRVTPYYALTRFGRWDEMLKEPAPPADGHAFLTGVYHYARGLAFLGRNQVAQAEQELAKLNALMAHPSLKGPLFSPNVAGQILAIAPEVLGGEIAAARGQYDKAVAHLEKAVRLEDALVYTEPSEWHYPPRLSLGAILLEAGRASEAETVYWEDLRRNRENGWALFGLAQALKAQNKTEEAALIEARFRTAWERADVTLTASRFGRVRGAAVTSPAR